MNIKVLFKKVYQFKKLKTKNQKLKKRKKLKFHLIIIN